MPRQRERRGREKGKQVVYEHRGEPSLITTDDYSLEIIEDIGRNPYSFEGQEHWSQEQHGSLQNRDNWPRQHDRLGSSHGFLERQEHWLQEDNSEDRDPDFHESGVDVRRRTDGRFDSEPLPNSRGQQNSASGSSTSHRYHSGPADVRRTTRRQPFHRDHQAIKPSIIHGRSFNHATAQAETPYLYTSTGDKVSLSRIGAKMRGKI